MTAMRRQGYDSQQYAKGSVSTRRCSTLKPELQLTVVFSIKWFVLQNVSGKNYPSQDPRVPKMNVVWRYSSYFQKRLRKPENGYISEAGILFYFFCLTNYLEKHNVHFQLHHFILGSYEDRFTYFQMQLCIPHFV